MIFQISDLNALGRAPQTGDVLAIDTGTDTAKIDYNALATAIINKLGGDPVIIAHGGTGATTADGACENIGAVKTADVVNDLTSTSTTAPLSAAKGKELQDNKLNKRLIKINFGDNISDLATAIQTCVFSIGDSNFAGITFYVGATNASPFIHGSNYSGTLFVNASYYYEGVFVNNTGKVVVISRSGEAATVSMSALN